MANIPRQPLLRLNKPAAIKRRGGGRFAIPRKFSPNEQSATPAGNKLTHLSRRLAAGEGTLELRADPAALAPERLLVFELTGSVYQFDKAVKLVSGLELLGSEDLDETEDDASPVVYLMVPSDRALREIESLWRKWQAKEPLPEGFSTWKTLLSQLKDVRPWGPQDRISAGDFEILESEIANGTDSVRVELELVYRDDAQSVEAAAQARISALGGRVISRCLIRGAGYHALLSDMPTHVLRHALQRDPTSLAGDEAIFQIRPQSVVQTISLEEVAVSGSGEAGPLRDSPIAAVFDAVPLSAHPLLADKLSIDDPFDLESRAVGPRKHGTAMASAALHGDLNHIWSRRLERRMHFVNVLYAPANLEHVEQFPDLLPADMFETALVRMFDGPEPIAPDVVIINASLGDPNKPFYGRMSGWARVVDYLSSKYGVLFVISAGNHDAYLETQNMKASAFEALSPADRARTALRASASEIARRRILAPAEAMNAITVGALHADNFTYPHSLASSIFDVWGDTGLCTVSSALGPGFNGATKPDILAPGGRHYVRLQSHGDHHRLRPLTTNAAAFGGIAVAAAPGATSLSANVTARSIGTSVAAALATGVAARAHEALEAAYPDFMMIPNAQRAALLKALLVHGARWTEARDLLVEILGPMDPKQHYRQKDNVRRYLGFGAYDPDTIINCADDRATLWAVGTIAPDQGQRFSVPWPGAMSGQAVPHSVRATLAWLSPPKAGSVAYRAARMKLVEPSAQLGTAGVKASGLQPDPKQAQKGTIIHRHWDGDRAAAIAGDGYFDIDVQREPDELPQLLSFGLVVTFEMQGQSNVYSQVATRLAVKPRVPVSA